MENEKKKSTKKSLYFFGGIALCLTSIILIINYGYIARVFAFPFISVFGLGSYFIYIYLYLLGLSILFRKKVIKIRFKHTFWAFVLFFIATLIIATLVMPNKTSADINTLTVKNCVNKFVDWNFNVLLKDGNTDTTKAYFNAKFINMFQEFPYGGGIVGYFLVGLLHNQVLCWIIAILIVLVGLFVLTYPLIMKIIHKNKKSNKSHEHKNDDEMNNHNQVLAVNDGNNSITNQRVTNIDVIKNASYLEDDYRPEVSSALPRSMTTQNTPANFEMDKNNPIRSSNSEISYSSNSYFIPAKFNLSHKENTMERSEPTPINRPTPNINTEQNKPVKTEQLSLNFDEKPQINNDLVTAMPVYEEQKVVTPTPKVEVMPSVQSQPQVAVETPQEVRKPIKWVPPSEDLLATYEVGEAIEKNTAVANERMQAINEIFNDFEAGAICSDFIVGPSVTRYNIKYEKDVSVRNVKNLETDLAIRLGGVNVVFRDIVEGSPCSGLEIPNAVITTVGFKEVYQQLPDKKKHPLCIPIGKNIEGKVVTCDLNEMPHALVAGTTGSGKSVFVHSIIATLIMRNSPDDVKLILIDPKRVEFSKYRDVAHLLCPIINDPSQAKVAMSKLVDEMERRYALFQDNPDGASKIEEYNDYCEANNLPKIPYIILIIDEFADLMTNCKDVSTYVQQIGQKARAAGIHMIIATQRPSTDVITGTIKGNLPTRFALSVASATDSITILGEGKAEKLLGKGDMYAQSPCISRAGAVRIQSSYISNKEIAHIVGYIKEHYTPYYDPNFLDLHDRSEEEGENYVNSPDFKSNAGNNEEAKYQEIKAWVMSNEYMSMSRIQRECGVGFNRAGRVFKRLQDEGIVATESEANKGCPVLVKDKFYEGSADTDIPVSSEVCEK